MIIHTVKEGDTVYSIAKKHNVSPTKILEDNDITAPNRLVVGEKLVILFPTKSYTVKAGDSLSSIASHFSVPLRTLYQNNPSLDGENTIYPGQILTIESPEKPLGAISSNGYAYPHIDMNTLKRTLPYLTYLTVFSARVLPDGHLRLPNDAQLISEAKKYGVAPILLLTNISENGGYSLSSAHNFLADPAARIRLLDELPKVLRERQYNGVEFDLEYVPSELAESYANLIEDTRRRLSAEGFCVFASAAPKESENQKGTLYEGHSYTALGEASNIVRLMTYECGFAYSSPMPIAPWPQMKRVADYALTAIPSNKIALGLPSYGYDWTLPNKKGTPAKSISAHEAVDLAARMHAQIEYDMQNQSPFFTYFDANTQEQHQVYFEDAESIKAKLMLISELGLQGVSLWNIMKYFPQYWLVLNSLFEIVRPFPCTSTD